jgi:DNA-binding SARP family transcriptional activator
VTTLEIKLLGTPQLTLDSRAITGLRRKNRALLYLLAAQSHSLSREYLLDFFWPDSERPLAQKVLRTMLYDLHKMLGEAMRVEPESIALGPGTVVDLQVFSTALKSPAPTLPGLEKALDLYRGDFLDGFSLPDASQFDDWAAGERERIRLMATQGWASLAHLYESHGDLSRALDAGRRALKFDPLQEDLQRDIMRLLYKNGDRTGMIRQYETLCSLLDEELGVPPMPETRALYAALINDAFDASQEVHGAARPARPLPPLPSVDIRPPAPRQGFPFTGRAAEIRAFEQLSLAGKLVLFEGEPGIGKSRLVDEIIQTHLSGQHRGQRPVLVLRGVAYELEQSLPYQPVIDILHGCLAHPELRSLLPELNLATVHLTEIARLIPELLAQYPEIPAPEQSAVEAHLWESLLQFFQSLSQKWQVWIFLDDLHWADSATLAWLGYFVRRASNPEDVLIATARPAEENTDLTRLKQALLREGRLAHIPLAPLTPDEMQTLVTRLNPAQDPIFSEWLVSSAEGNPFFLKELVQYVDHSGWLAANGSPDPDKFTSAMVVPPTIQNLVESRFLRLSENARDILHLAAIIGREFNLQLLGNATSLSETQVVDAVEELLTARLIQPVRGGSYAFDHSLTLEVACQDMIPARRQLYHRKVAEALVAFPTGQENYLSGLIAYHLVEAGLPARAAPYLLHAGKAAASLAAWEEAIAFYEQALQVEQDHGQRVEILLALGDARFHKGDMPQATDTLLQAVDLARSASNLAQLEQAYLELARSYFPQSRFAEAIALGQDLAQSGPSELAICAQFIWGAALSIESAMPVEAEKHLRCAEKLLDECPGYSGPITPALIQYQLAAVLGEQGKSAEAVALYRQALALVQANEANLDMLRRIMLYNNLAYHLFLIHDPTAAGYAEAGIKLAQERGSLTHLPYLFSTSGEIALGQGDLDAAETYFSEGLKLAEQVAGAPFEAIAGLTANLGLVARKRGQDELAQKRLTQALVQADQVGNRHLAVRIRIWMAPLLPDDEARACLNEAQSLAEEASFQGLLEEIGSLRANLAQR